MNTESSTPATGTPPVDALATPRAPRCGAVLVAGLSATVAMWWVGYATHVPAWAASIPAPVTFSLLFLCWLIAGGMLYRAGGTMPMAACAGLTSSLANLLVFYSVFEQLLRNGEADRGSSPGTMQVTLCFLLVGAAAMTLGAWLARMLMGQKPRPTLVTTDSPVGGLGLAAGAATLLVLGSGGVVTTLEEGMAVPDWPTSFEVNMFLLPLSKMVGGVFYEHAHRLSGTLVGLTTLAWACYAAFEQRALRSLLGAVIVAAACMVAFKSAGLPNVRVFLYGSLSCVLLWGAWHVLARPRARYASAAILILFMVCVQGAVGGARVVENLSGGRGFAALHGISGQIVFATLVTVAAFGTRRWRVARRQHFGQLSKGDRTLGRVLMVLLVLQLTLGALQRHYGSDWLMIHIVGAVALSFVAVGAGTRALGLHGAITPVKHLGLALCIAVVAQFALGFAAMAAIGQQQGRPEGTFAALIPTLHMALGALVFVTGTALASWATQLFDPSRRVDPESNEDAVRKAVLGGISSTDTSKA